MPSLTVENYLKVILQSEIRSKEEWASTGQLATALGGLAGHGHQHAQDTRGFSTGRVSTVSGSAADRLWEIAWHANGPQASAD